MAAPPKPDIVEKESGSPVEYTPEELEIIKELTSLFNRAPGQVDVPDTPEEEPEAETPASEEPVLEESDPEDEGLDDSEVSALLGLEPEEPPAAPEPTPEVGGLDDLGDLGDTPDALRDLGDTPAPDAGGLDDLGGLDDAPADALGDLGDLGDTPPADALGDLGDLGDAPADALGDLGDLGDAPPAEEGGGLEDLGGLDDAPADALGDLGDLGDAPPAEEGGGLEDLGGLDDAPADALGDLGDLGDTPPAEEGGGLEDIGGLDDAPADALGDLGDLGDAPPVEEGGGLEDLSDAPPPTPVQEPPPDISSPPSLEDLSPTVALSTQPPEPEPISEMPAMAPTYSGDGAHFSDEEIKQIRKKLKNYPLQLRRLAINSIIEDKLAPEETKKLIKMISSDASVQEVQRFLEGKLGIELGDLEGEKAKKTKVIVSQSDYTVEGLEKSAKRAKLIKYGGLAALLIMVVGLSLYSFVIKPWIYHDLISEGKELILEKSPSSPSLNAINQAEALFNKAILYYPDRLDAYLQYAGAYHEVGLYENTFGKLFGRVSLQSPIRLEGAYISGSNDYWKKIKKVPTVSYLRGSFNQLRINNSSWLMKKKGAYLITHLDRQEANAMVLMALGKFHSNPVKRFKTSPYRNNLLGIDYFKRILTFDAETPLFKENEYFARALGGIGDVYYQQKNYYKSNEYLKKSSRISPAA